MTGALVKAPTSAGEVPGPREHPRGGPVAARGQPLRRHADRGHVRLHDEFYEHFGPGRRFHQLAHDIAARMPGIGHLAASARCAPPTTTRGRRSSGRARARLSRRRLRDVPPDVALGPDRVRRPQGLHQAGAGGGRADRAGRCDRRPGDRALRRSRPGGSAKLTRLDRFARIKVLPIALAPPFGVSVLDLPTRMPLPAKIKVEVRPPIDLRERFGPDPDADVHLRRDHRRDAGVARRACPTSAPCRSSADAPPRAPVQSKRSSSARTASGVTSK